MVKLREEVFEKETGLLGQVTNVNYTSPKPYGVSFSDDSNEIHWRSREEIERRGNIIQLVIGQGLNGSIKKTTFTYEVNLSTIGWEDLTIGQILTELNLIHIFNELIEGDSIMFEDIRLEAHS